MKNILILILSITSISELLSNAYGLGFLGKDTSLFKSLAQSTQNSTSQTVCSLVNMTEYNGLTLSGYLSVAKNSSSALGFIFHGAKGYNSSNIAHLPTIIWLSGGPGVSSQSSYFHQNGPFTLEVIDEETFKFIENKNSWTNEYNVLFMDQPISTGISYAADDSEIPKTIEEVTEHLYYALNELYFNPQGCFKQYGLEPKVTPLFVYGDSYSGKFVPAIGEKIMQDGNKLNLVGIGMINGFTATVKTIVAVNDFSRDQHFITNEQHQDNLEIIEELKQAMKDGEMMKAKLLEEKLLNAANPDNVYIYNIDFGSLNAIEAEATNTTEPQPDSDIPQQPGYITLFQSNFAKKFYNLTLLTDYQALSGKVFEAMINDYMRDNIVEKVEYLLNKNVYVHVIGGNLDLAVPHYSQEMWISELKWKHIQKYKSQVVKIIRDGKQIIASSKSYKNLAYNLVFDAGHAIANDQPERMNIVLKDAIFEAMVRSNHIAI